MIALQADSFSWAADASGMRLTLRTPRAKEIAAQTKPDKQYDVEIKEHSKKRSLTANAYYHVLKGKLAEALKLPEPYVHNMMLRRYGQREFYDGEPSFLFLPDTEETQNKADLSETYHIQPTSHTRVGKGGKVYRLYYLLRGSSTYDSKEMARLIDGLVEECKQVDIETMTPEELARLEGYEKRVW